MDSSFSFAIPSLPSELLAGHLTTSEATFRDVENEL